MKDYFDPKSNMMVSDKIAYEEATKKPTVIIEEYVNVDETFQNIKNIKVGSMTLNDLFGDNLKVIEKALEERKELLKWKDSKKDLIKGKDEHIARLIDDNKKLRDRNTCLRIENANILGKPFLPNSNKPKVVEVYNLNENDITNLIKFAQVIAAHAKTGGGDYLSIHIVCDDGEKDYPILKEVVEKYGR